MSILRRASLALFALVVLTLSACAGPQLTNAWRSPEFAGPPPSKILVLGLSSSDSTRRIFEDGFAQALVAAGESATAAYPELPEKGVISSERLKTALAKSGAQAVLITRLLQVDEEVSVTPSSIPPGRMYGGYYGFYGGAWAAMPPTIDTYKILTIETTLWDTRSDKVIWSGTTRTNEVTDIARATKDLAAVLIERMKKDGVI